MADPLDVLTLNEGKTAVGQPSVDTTALAAAITAVSRFLDQLVGPVVRRDVTGEVLEVTEPTEAVWAQQWPIVDIDQAVAYDTDGDPVALTVETATVKPAEGIRLTGYTGRPAGLYSGRIRRTRSGRPVVFDPGAVVVSYTAGRYASTAAVDPYFKEPAAVLLVNLYQRHLAGVAPLGEYDTPRFPFPAFAVPRFVRDALVADWQAS